jgi:hypothetical protein
MAVNCTIDHECVSAIVAAIFYERAYPELPSLTLDIRHAHAPIDPHSIGHRGLVPPVGESERRDLLIQQARALSAWLASILHRLENTTSSV